MRTGAIERCKLNLYYVSYTFNTYMFSFCHPYSHFKLVAQMKFILFDYMWVSVFVRDNIAKHNNFDNQSKQKGGDLVCVRARAQNSNYI